MEGLYSRDGQPLKIGVSARFFHRAPVETGLNGRRLLYLEQSIAHWVMSRGALAFLIPTVPDAGGPYAGPARAADFARALDGLLLQGGVDISPITYGEDAMHPDWCGDPVRDRYELDLLNAFIERGKPVLGICRGAQLINIAFGGSLYQDIPSQVDASLAHRDQAAFDGVFHPLHIRPGSGLSRLYGVNGGLVNTLHHQAVKTVGRELAVEALAPDGVVEAIRWTGDGYVFGVQWHPEFHPARKAEGVLDSGPILEEFLQAASPRCAAGRLTAA